MSLKITDAAMNLIKDRLSRTDVMEPIVRLLEQSPVFKPSDSFVRAVTGSELPESKQVLRSTSANDAEVEMLLVPAIFPRAKASSWLLKEFQGVKFEVPLGMRLGRCELDVGAGCLVLRDARGRILLPHRRKLPHRGD